MRSPARPQIQFPVGRVVGDPAGDRRVREDPEVATEGTRFRERSAAASPPSFRLHSRLVHRNRRVDRGQRQSGADGGRVAEFFRSVSRAATSRVSSKAARPRESSIPSKALPPSPHRSAQTTTARTSRRPGPESAKGRGGARCVPVGGIQRLLMTVGARPAGFIAAAGYLLPVADDEAESEVAFGRIVVSLNSPEGVAELGVCRSLGGIRGCFGSAASGFAASAVVRVFAAAWFIGPVVCASLAVLSRVRGGLRRSAFLMPSWRLLEPSWRSVALSPFQGSTALLSAAEMEAMGLVG